MTTRFVAGQQYLVTREHYPYIKAGAIVTRLDDNSRFLVRWSDCVSTSLREGDPTTIGYDAINRTYRLKLDVAYIVELPTEHDHERMAQIQQSMDNRENISEEEMVWFSAYNGGVPDDYVLACDVLQYMPKDDCYHCPVADHWYSTNDRFVTAYDRNADEIYAHYRSLERSSEYFLCARSDTWYSRRYYSAVYVADQDEYWCQDEYENELSYCEEDDNWYADPDNMPEPSCHIPSYHSQSRKWKVPDGITLGVELEVYVNDPEGAYTNRASEIIGERDGSLDSEKGIEFIGPPMSYADYSKYRNPWQVTLEAINNADVQEDSYEDRKDGYGMHISVGRRALSHEVQARFVLFINNCQNFSEFIAQRSQNRWAAYDKKDVNHVREAFMLSSGSWGSKYAATHIDSERIEVRIFKSVTEPELFQKNIDYVFSALMFATEHTDVLDVVSVQKYLTWLNGQQGYDALKAFIGDNGSRFTDSDSRRIMLHQSGFIIEESDNDSTI